MTISTTKKLAGTAGAALLIAALSGCGAPPEPTPTDTDAGNGGSAVEGFLPCVVSGASPGGFQDKSFNQLAYEGLERAAGELGVDFIPVRSTTTSDFAPNIQSLIDQNCTLIVTVGFDLANATTEAAAANPDVQFVQVDEMLDAPNIKSVVFDTAQAAFLAGYASASFSTTDVVGTFGGGNFPSVSIFMDGFAQGVEHWNAEKGENVEVLGWDRATQDGVFTGTFVPGPDAVNAAQGLVDKNADVLLPVGGEIYQSAAAVIRDSGLDIALLGVDADVFLTDPSVAELLLTSVLKAVDVGVEEAVLAAGKGEFDNAPFIGTLENNGVGIAPFHDFEDRVAAELQDELDAIRAGIIDGSIVVESYLAD